MDEKGRERGLIGDIKRFLRNNNFKDFTITINNVEFDVHRFLLEARSPVLGELIRNNPDVNSLNLDHEVPVHVFKHLLDFLYEDKMPEDGDDMMGIFDAAGRLELTDLKQFAADKLREKLNVRNAMETFILGSKYKCAELKKAAFDEIKEAFPEVKIDENLLFHPEKVEQLLKKKLEFDSEINGELKKIEELKRSVEMKQKEKVQWLNAHLAEHVGGEK